MNYIPDPASPASPADSPNRPAWGSKRRQAILVAVLGACAAVSLCANLGALPLRGAEGRWAVIARHMFRTGELLNPMMGLEAYWDKPLLSYWQILPFAWIAGGVTEQTARLPSALWALVLLALTFDLARRWFGGATAFAAAGALATSFGFIEWGRNALVEMSNAGVILLALWCFLVYRSDRRRAWVFWLALITGLGANLKGLPAYAVPGFAILLFSLARSDWKWLPPWRTLLAAGALSLAVYLAIPAAACAWSSSAEPLRLVWKENVVRFFEPFDHKEPFYTYAWRIFDLGAPWALLLPAALPYYLARDRRRESRMADVLVLAGAIFLFFTLSGSRRRYYILPILPFLAIVAGDMLARFGRGELPRATSRAVSAVVIFSGAVVACVAPAYFVAPAFLQRMPANYGALLPAALLLTAAGVSVVVFTLRRNVAGILIPAVAMTCLCSLVAVPWLAGQPESLKARESTARLRAEQRPIAFLHSADSSNLFYLDREFVVLQSEEAAEQWSARTQGLVIVKHGTLGRPWRCVFSGANWNAYGL